MSLSGPITDHGCVERDDAAVRAHTVPLTVAVMAKPMAHTPMHAKPNATALLPRLATSPHGREGGAGLWRQGRGSDGCWRGRGRAWAPNGVAAAKRGAAWEGAARRLARAPRAGRPAPAGRAAIGPRRREGARDWRGSLPAALARARSAAASLRSRSGLGGAAPAAPGLAWAERRHLLPGARVPGSGGAHARPVMPRERRPGSASAARRGARRR